MENTEREVQTASSGASAISDVTQPVNKVTKSMQDILKELVEKRKLLDEQEMILAFSAQEVDGDYSNNEDVEKFDTPSDSLKLFASFLHWYNPEAYEYIRQNYSTPLPDIKVLSRWCQNNKFQAGFTKQAFDMLEKKSKESGKKLICTLITHKYQLFVHDSYVSIDVGGGGLEDDYACEIEGRFAYIILLVGLEETWKIPVGYFLVDQTSKQTEANIITMVLHRCHEIGVDIISITAAPGVARMLGCKVEDRKDQATFRHPASGNLVTTFLNPILNPHTLHQAFDQENACLIAKKAMGQFVGAFLKSNPRQLGGKFPKIYKTLFKDFGSKLTSKKKA